MEKKKQPELIVMAVMLISGVLAIVSAVRLFFGDLAGSSIFIGSSIMFAASIIARAMQWASEGKDE